MNPTAKLALNLVTIFLAALLFAPTAAIIVSWNALPGDTLYSTKRTLEKGALVLTAGSYQTNTSLQTQLVSRRTTEAVNTIFKKSSSAGLEELRAQVELLRRQVQAAQSEAERREAAQRAITQLQQSQQKLKTTKVTLAKREEPLPSPTVTHVTIVQQVINYLPLPQPSPSPTPSAPSSPAPIEPQPSDNLIDEIDETEKDIEDAIDDISTTPSEEQEKDDTLNEGEQEHPNQGQEQNKQQEG